MGFRFQRRINLGKGAGLNLSKSGVSTSVRTRYGTIGSKGFSVRTGVSGLTYRSRYRKGSDAGLIVLLMLAVVALLPLIFRLLLAVVQGLVMAAAWTARAVSAGANKLLHGGHRDTTQPRALALPRPQESEKQLSKE